MLVPGIIASLDRPQQQQQLAQQQQAQEAADAADKNNKEQVEFAISGLHQHDIRVLMNAKTETIITPSSVVQDRINFLVSNTDPNNIETNAQELASLVKPEIYPFFADYMVVRRISLEPNNHKMYLTLLSKFDDPVLDRCIRLAAIKACRRVIASDSVRNASNERSLLKALGSWLGIITLAKNIPILARELDLLELVPRGIVEGKLIAVVPFIARVLEAAGQSRAFAVPNPWLLGILSQLVEMYQLPELKITLRFEVEVLCRNLNVSIEAIADYMRPNPRRWNLLELKNRFVDVSDSFDFKPSQDDQFVSKKLTPDAPEFRPRGVGSPQTQGPTGMGNNNPGGMMMGGGGAGGGIMPNNNNVGVPVNNPYTNQMNGNINANNSMMNSNSALNQGQLGGGQQQPQQTLQQRLEIRPTAEFMQNVPPHIRDSLRQLMMEAGELAFNEVMQTADRPMAIAMVCARDIALKDFCHDPDHNALVTAAKILARSLTTHLISVSLRDAVVNALKKATVTALQRLGVNDQNRLAQEAENFARENLDRFAAVLDEAVADSAQRHVTQLLTQQIEERNKMLQHTGSLMNAVPPHTEQFRPPNLPEALRPRGTLGNTHRQIYEDFRGMLGTLRNPRDQIQSLLRDVEADAIRHYQLMAPAPNTLLSLTKPEFTSTALSEFHVAIRQRVIDVPTIVATIAEYNLQITLETTFKALVLYSEACAARRPQANSDPQTVLQFAIAQLLMEVCLFTLQKLRDKFLQRVPLEITRFFFAHERRWQLRETATSLGRSSSSISLNSTLCSLLLFVKSRLLLTPLIALPLSSSQATSCNAFSSSPSLPLLLTSIKLCKNFKRSPLPNSLLVSRFLPLSATTKLVVKLAVNSKLFSVNGSISAKSATLMLASSKLPKTVKSPFSPTSNACNLSVC
jgi:CCR4-NOT transcription complex subunit 1